MQPIPGTFTFLQPLPDRLCISSVARNCEDGTTIRVLALEEIELVTGDWDSARDFLDEYFFRFEDSSEPHFLAVNSSFAGPCVAEQFVDACTASCDGLKELRSSARCPGFSVGKSFVSTGFELLKESPLDDSAVTGWAENELASKLQTERKNDLFQTLAMAAATLDL